MTAPDPITLLERKIRKLNVEFERFFSGAIPIPPEPMRDEIRDQIRALRAASSPSLVFSFRLNNVEAKFNSFNELFNRKMRNGGARSRRAAPPPEARGQDDSAPSGARDNVLVGTEPDPHSAERIYESLYASDAQKPSLSAFKAFLAQQVRRIQEQTGCDKVKLRVSTDKGKARLRAKPVEAS